MKTGVFIAGLLLGFTASADVFSPGPLARPHASLEGISNCTRCHPSGQALSQESCLACHVELKPRLAKSLGLHGRIPAAERSCENCHPEHKGLEFQLVDWGKAGKALFAHSRTGWALKGKHEKVKCDSCHQKGLIVSETALQLLPERPHTLLGLKAACKVCHFDEHRGQLESADCDYCHQEAGWKPAPGFNHQETQFPLRGQHVKVACTKCHPSLRDAPGKVAFPAAVSETYLKLAPLEHQGCGDCHKDAHDGRFGAKCSSCHTVEGWRLIRNAAQERGFHDQTRFPLKGEHLDVACQTCHGPFPGLPAKFKGLPFKECNNCHSDGHQGQLAVAQGRQPDCDACHAVQGFAVPRYTLKQHQQTRYPLEGAHQVVGCSQCHLKTPSLLEKVPKSVRADLKRRRRQELFSTALFDFNKPLDRCETCHADVHAGQFDQTPSGCAHCHQVSSFTELRFDHQRDTRYPLTGRHAKVSCERCHAPAKKGSAVLYRPLETRCASCHVDPHAGQLTHEGHGCEDCHITADFKQTRFKHQPPFTDFLLDGQHQQVKCEGCHHKVQVSKELKVQRFVGLPRTCEGCHADFHHGAFKGFEP